MPAIRPATRDDAGAIHDIYAPFVAETAVSFETEVPSREAIAGRITDTQEQFPWLVCEVDGAVAGYAYGHAHRGRGGYRWSAESSVYVAEAHLRRGVARGLYESLFTVLALQRYVNCYAGIVLPNDASVTFHESMGFERVGRYEDVGYKHGEWRDTLWLRRELREPPADPAEPRPFPAVRTDDAFESAIEAGETSVR
ncbi:GNAT family N-acetyltransferase [Haloarchaeobius amylolyticus]|uniref:GNAT family N-acetyltransferase n=1 Tax=Haloarchaeobius amylolyticus TaxID=1198296 RepID=UPI00226FC108